MPYSRFRFVIVGLLLATDVASAQVQPGGGMGPMGGGGPTPAGEEKKEGVAEAAPKTPGLLPTTPALPSAKGRKKRWKLFELDGYFRLRTDWFKNFHEGFVDDPTLGGAPFPRSLGCGSLMPGAPCDSSIGSSNMRLRLEPTINIDEGTSVHIQADVLDNVILGSTPTGEALNGSTTTPPLGAFNGTVDPVNQGTNSDRAGIIIKRAWAEVAVPLGILTFGRMPNQWGMGMLYNAGGVDPINGTTDYDADYGDTVDRAAFTAPIPGTPLRAMIAADWASSRLSSNLTDAGFGHYGHPFDLDDSDDMKSWVGVISKLDTPQDFKDTVDRGDVALNYGVYFEYKTQSWDNDLTGQTVGGTFDAETRYVLRGLTMYNPDVWAKLGYGPVTLEAELAAQLGSIDDVSDVSTRVGSVGIRRFGGTARATWKGLENKLKLGIEGGFASGDQCDSTIQGRTNIAYADQLCVNSTDSKATQFAMNREYKVDMILWRHLYGAVTNAVYVKPFLSYQLTNAIGFKVANITSFALKSVATPGNGSAYGTEFDADLGYNQGGIFAGISYGVLFPFAALSHPAADANTGAPELGYDTNTGEASTSHTIQMRFVLGF